MNALIINDHGETNIECNDMKFEGGFVIFQKDKDEEIFVNPAKVTMMEITGRPKKPVKKIKKEA